MPRAAVPVYLCVPCRDSADGIHPNARGYLRVAEVVATGLGCHAGMPVPYSALRLLPEYRFDSPPGSARDASPALSER